MFAQQPAIGFQLWQDDRCVRLAIRYHERALELQKLLNLKRDQEVVSVLDIHRLSLTRGRTQSSR